MRPIELRRSVGAWPRRTAIVAAIVAVSGSVALHHTGVHVAEDSAMYAVTTTIELCMAVLPLAAAASALSVAGSIRVRRQPASILLIGAAPAVRLHGVPFARAGPRYLVVLRR